MTRQERRHAQRTHSNVPLELYDPKGRFVIGEAHFVNMSETGALMESRKPLRPKEKVRLHIASVGETPLELQGRVVWARKKRPGFAYGIRFAHPS